MIIECSRVQIPDIPNVIFSLFIAIRDRITKIKMPL